MRVGHRWLDTPSSATYKNHLQVWIHLCSNQPIDMRLYPRVDSLVIVVVDSDGNATLIGSLGENSIYSEDFAGAINDLIILYASEE